MAPQDEGMAYRSNLVMGDNYCAGLARGPIRLLDPGWWGTGTWEARRRTWM